MSSENRWKGNNALQEKNYIYESHEPEVSDLPGDLL